MPADFSRKRSTLQHHAYVELKQGAVLLDSDFNESHALLDRSARARTADTAGHLVVARTTPDAFEIGIGPTGGLLIGKGRVYVDGILAENHGAPSSAVVLDTVLGEPTFSEALDYSAQPFFPGAQALPQRGRFLIFLDVWQREVTQLEQPDLVEVAVGVETSARVQNVWQVRLLEVDTATSCETPDPTVPGWAELVAPSSGMLSTGTFEVAAVDDPCELPPTGGYRGLENQLYRVEIHDPGQPGVGATFKWSREGGSVGSVVVSVLTASDLELATLGRDDVLGFKTGDWVEIVDDVREFSQGPGEIRRITLQEGTRVVHLSEPLPVDMLPGALPDSTFPRERHLRVRLWNQSGAVLRTDPSGSPVEIGNLDAPNSPGVIAVPAPGTALLLEDGVTVSFDSPQGGVGFKTGDYWLFAARTADASVEVLDRAPPRGIHHHFARLAIWDAATHDLADCRVQPTPPQGDAHDCGCTACVTADSHNSGEFTIQQAVEQVRETGGTVCLGPGGYRLSAPVLVTKARGLRIRGQGTATRIESAGGAFSILDSRAVVIESMAIRATGVVAAIDARHTADLTLQELDLEVKSDGAPAISLQGVVINAAICRSSINAPAGVVAGGAVGADGASSFLLLVALRIEDNDLACRERGIVVSEEGIRMSSVRIARNQLTGCGDAGIRVLGMSVRESSLTVTNNELNVAGDGIIFSAENAWVESNQVVRVEAAAKGRVGIGMVAGLTPLGTARCQVLANQVAGFAHAGIEVTGPARDVIIKLNIIERCGNGILAVPLSSEASLSIENNHLRELDGEVSSSAEVLGIFVAHASAAAIAGNSIQSLGARSPNARLRAGILTVGMRHSRISGNELSDIAALEGAGVSAGIMLVPPHVAFEVQNNRVERDASSAGQLLTGEWFALLTAPAATPGSGVVHTASFATLAVEARTIVIGAGHPGVVNFPGAASGKPAEPRGAVLGNVLSARSGQGTPAVRVEAADECSFSDNRVAFLGDAPFAVELVSSAPIVQANRVQGGRKNSIDVRGTRTPVVLANITTTPILADGADLEPPWKQLNIVEQP